jgi:UDP-glucose 4-epimerase
MGFIGRHIVDGAVALGHEVLVLDDTVRSARCDVPAGAVLCTLDPRDPGELGRALCDFRPVAVCHQASDANASASAALEACANSGVRALVIGGPSSSTRETLGPVARVAGDEQECPVRTVTLRYANVFGPGQDAMRETGVVGTFIAAMLRDEPIRINACRRRGDDGCVRDYVFVGDVVRATIAALDPRFGHRVMDVCTGRPTTTRALAEHIRRLCGSHSSICHAARRPGDVLCSVLDPTRCRAYYQPTSLQSGLVETIAWFDERAWRDEPVSARLPRPEALAALRSAGDLRLGPDTAA